MSEVEPVVHLSKFLEAINVRVVSYDPSKVRPLKLSTGPACTIDKFASSLRNEYIDKLFQFPGLASCVRDTEKLRQVVEEYSRENNAIRERGAGDVPEELRDVVLYWDVSKDTKDPYFFIATKEGRTCEVKGYPYLRMRGMDIDSAIATATQVVPEYRPRSPTNTFEEIGGSGKRVTIFNKYSPPPWKSYRGKLPDELPKEFEMLVHHLFPFEVEREFFFHWLYGSLFDRAMTFLVLCGNPGVGKNTLKLVMRALHGEPNAVDGKGSTLRERFNSQLSESTLIWFDELRYTEETENAMKEMQNDSISIERKGVDASKSTRVYASTVISNNKPRDNFIAFDARKFAPLQLTETRLENGGMSTRQIDRLVYATETTTRPEYDLKFVAQIGRWVEKHGRSNSPEWNRYEYRGPMFYKLAHTSMTRWQKRAVRAMLTQDGLTGPKVIYDSTRGYLWSTVQEVLTKKNSDRAMQFPEASTVKSFFDVFAGLKGERVFKTTPRSGEDFVTDFYVKLLVKSFEVHKDEEEEVKRGNKKKEVKDEETYDL